MSFLCPKSWTRFQILSKPFNLGRSGLIDSERCLVPSTPDSHALQRSACYLRRQRRWAASRDLLEAAPFPTFNGCTSKEEKHPIAANQEGFLLHVTPECRVAQ